MTDLVFLADKIKSSLKEFFLKKKLYKTRRLDVMRILMITRTREMQGLFKINNLFFFG
jgi:hypothetical protein